MKKFEDLVGKRFGRLTVTSHAFIKNQKHYWNCVCECGIIPEKPKSASDLRGGKIKSCGCLRNEMFSVNRKKSHLMTGTRIHTIWTSMNRRCSPKNKYSYRQYFGRGITVCEEWKRDFITFYGWAIRNGYDDTLTIDRIDNNAGYSPSNCRWVSRKIQNNNKTNNRTLFYKGKKYTATELAEIFGIIPATLLWRIKNNWPESQWAMQPSYSNKRRRKCA